jgi:DNA-directed RNA polymerase subunit RPC12/RpoP
MGMSGLGAWLFTLVGWHLIWRSRLARHPMPLSDRLAIVGLAALAGVVSWLSTEVLLYDRYYDGYWLPAFIASVTVPLAWLVLMIVMWKEAPAKSADGHDVRCPACGYNLRGLSEARCPECGKRFTLDELFNAQPGRDLEKLEKIEQ